MIVICHEQILFNRAKFTQNSMFNHEENWISLTENIPQK